MKREKLYALKLTREELWVLMDNFGKTYAALDPENTLEVSISQRMADLYLKASNPRQIDHRRTQP